MSVIRNLQDGLELARQQSQAGLCGALLTEGIYCLLETRPRQELEAQFHLPTELIAAEFPLVEPNVRLNLTRQFFGQSRQAMSQTLLHAIDGVLDLLAFNSRLAQLRPIALDMITTEQEYMVDSVRDFAPSVGRDPSDRSLYLPGSTSSYVHFMWNERKVPQRVVELSMSLFRDLSDAELSEVLAEQLILDIWDWETEQTWNNNRALPIGSGLVAA